MLFGRLSFMVILEPRTKEKVVPSRSFSLQNIADNKLDQSMVKDGLCSVVMMFFDPPRHFLQAL